MSLILLGILNSQVSAAGGGPAYDLLETQVLTSSTASVSFTGLGSYSDYKHLQLRAQLKTTFTLGDSVLQSYLRFNGVTSGGLYAWHSLWANDGNIRANTNATSQDVISIYKSVAHGNTTNTYSGVVMDILDFSDTNKNTTLRSFNGCYGHGDQNINITSGMIRSTSAITSFSLEPEAGSYATGSRFSLYGIKGA